MASVVVALDPVAPGDRVMVTAGMLGQAVCLPSVLLGDWPVAATAARGADPSVHVCLTRLRGQARANAGVDEGERAVCAGQ
eukprot:2590557-Lingulodinium_polyedra.AAC.1